MKLRHMLSFLLVLSLIPALQGQAQQGRKHHDRNVRSAPPAMQEHRQQKSALVRSPRMQKSSAGVTTQRNRLAPVDRHVNRERIKNRLAQLPVRTIRRGDVRRHVDKHHTNKHHHGIYKNSRSVVIYPAVPFYPYTNHGLSYSPFGSSPNAQVVSDYSYPNRYFVCYQVEQIGDGYYHIACPVPFSWYSTAPMYNTYENLTTYQPQYVCPNNAAGEYAEFDASAEAYSWSNAYCNQSIEEADLP